MGPALRISRNLHVEYRVSRSSDTSTYEVPLTGNSRWSANGQLAARSSPWRVAQFPGLLDDFVGAHEDRVGDLDAERFRGFHVDDQLETRRPLYR